MQSKTNSVVFSKPSFDSNNVIQRKKIQVFIYYENIDIKLKSADIDVSEENKISKKGLYQIIKEKFSELNPLWKILTYPPWKID